MEGGLLLDVIIRESATIFKLLAGEDQALLVRGNTLLVLDLGLNIIDGIRGFDFKGDGLAGEGLDEDLHARPTAQTQHQVESRLLLDVVVSQSATILQLLASKDQALLIRGNSFLVLNLALDVVDGVGGLDLKGDGLAYFGLAESSTTGVAD